MRTIFLIESSTINLENYTIKDIPGSTSRLDVISRAILAAMLGDDGFDKDIEIWVFLEGYGNYIFKSNEFNYEKFPKNEILFSDYFVKHIRKIKESNPLKRVERSDLSIFDALEVLINQDFQIFLLEEHGQDFSSFFKDFTQKSKIVFIIGNQLGEMIPEKELKSVKFTRISLGGQSYLASAVIRLIKLNLRLII